MKKFIILIPVYNDWDSVFKLLEHIDFQVDKWDAEVSVLIVNDASTLKNTSNELNFKKLKSVRVINMKKNKGHARCNAAGLKFLIEKNDKFDHVIVMDGDGEDRPEELNLLFKKSKENPLKVVTANRTKRSEGLFFKTLYECHKILTYIFTGKYVQFGNYSCLPKNEAEKLIKEACIWSSFSGSVIKLISNRTSISSVRGKRYTGPSKMNLFSLLIHSFSIIAVFKKLVLIRSVLFSLIYLFFIYNYLSFFTIFPLLAVFIFLLSIFKISSRENILELNKSLENIDSIQFLSNFNSR